MRVGLTASPPGPSAGGHIETSHSQEASRWRKGLVAAARERKEARTTKHFILIGGCWERIEN